MTEKQEQNKPEDNKEINKPKDKLTYQRSNRHKRKFHKR
jgi:hypothetical protein